MLPHLFSYTSSSEIGGARRFGKIREKLQIWSKNWAKRPKMFVDLVLHGQKREKRLGLAWVAGTRGIKYVAKEDVLELDVPKLCEEIREIICSQSDSPRVRFSLRLSSVLVNGTLKIYEQKAVLCIDDIHKVFTQITEDQRISSASNVEATGSPPSLEKRGKKRPHPVEKSDLEQMVIDVINEEQRGVAPPVIQNDEAVLQARTDDVTLRETQLLRAEETDDFDIGVLLPEDEELILGGDFTRFETGPSPPKRQQVEAVPSKPTMQLVEAVGPQLPAVEPDETEHQLPVEPDETEHQLPVEPDETEHQLPVEPDETEHQLPVEPDETEHQLPVEPEETEHQLPVEPDETEHQLPVEPDETVEMEIEEISPAESPEKPRFRRRTYSSSSESEPEEEAVQITIQAQVHVDAAREPLTESYLQKKTKVQALQEMELAKIKERDYEMVGIRKEEDSKLLVSLAPQRSKQSNKRDVDKIEYADVKAPHVPQFKILVIPNLIKIFGKYYLLRLDTDVPKCAQVSEVSTTLQRESGCITPPAKISEEAIPQPATPELMVTAETPKVSDVSVVAETPTVPLEETVEEVMAVDAEEAPSRKRPRLMEEPTTSRDLELHEPTISVVQKFRQQEIVNNVSTSGRVTLEDICQKPIGKLHIARAFNDILLLCKHNYVKLVSARDSLELKIIEKGSKVFG